MDFITKTTPFPFQLEALRLGCFKEYFAYFMDMGTGKSKVTIDTAATLFHHNHINFMLLTCPKFVSNSWINEQLPEHMGVDYAAIRYVPSKGRSKTYIKELKDFKNTKNALKIVVCNYEAFLNRDNVNEFYNMLRVYRALWVVDESSRIKNYDAVSSNTIIKLAPHARYRRILTGTPITKDLCDLWAQYKFLHPQIIDCDTFVKFKNKFTIQEPIPNNWLKGRLKGNKSVVVQRVVGFKNTKTLLDLINPHTFRIKLDGNIPEPIFLRKEVELTPEQSRAYNDVKEKVQIEILDELRGGDVSTIDISSTMGKISKLQQILCGFIYDEEHKPIRIKNNRAKICADIICESSSPVIIFYWFREARELIVEELTKRKISYTEDPDLFNSKPDEYSVFLGQMASKSMGLNLQRAKITIYYNNTVFAEYRWQSERRNYRLGQDSTVVYIDLITPGTVEEGIIDNIASKTIRARLIDQIQNPDEYLKHSHRDAVIDIVNRFVLDK